MPLQLGQTGPRFQKNEWQSFVGIQKNHLVYFSSILLSIIAIVIPYTFLGNMIGLVAIPFKFLSIIIVVPILYCIVALFAKRIYIKKYKEWI